MSEVNKLLQERVGELEDVLKKASEGPKRIGIIKAGPINGFYRVDVSGSPMIIPHNVGLNKIEIGKSVLVNEHFIEQELPEELHLSDPPPDFNLIEWSDIGGMKSQIERIRDNVENPIIHTKLYKEFNLAPSKGILLYGPPGCGKTMVAKAIASTILKKLKKVESNSFIYMKGGEMLSPYVGVAENNIKVVFDNCRRHYKNTGIRSVLFIDEAEAILPQRGSRRSSDIETTIVPTFLAEMDGFEGDNPLVILATNYPYQIDEAIQRPGRIDVQIEISRPDIDDAEEIFNIYLNKTKAENITKNSKKAAEMLFKIPSVENKISGAMISNIVSQSISLAIKRRINNPKDKTGVSIDDLEQVILSCK